MKDDKSLIISVLSISACIMITILVLMHISTASADTSVRGGNYIMCTGSIRKATSLLYVINIAKQRMIVYAPDAPRNNLIPIDQVNLNVEFKGR